MKAIRCLVLIVATLTSIVSAGCATESTSTGLLKNQTRTTLPQGVPVRVAVIFDGHMPIASQAADQFSSALFALGFNVVERNHIESLLKEHHLIESGYVSPETGIRIGKLAGLDGVFVGTVSGERSRHWVDTHLNIKLVRVETGEIVWAANVNDPRTIAVSMDPATSIIYTTNHAISLLKHDLSQ